MIKLFIVTLDDMAASLTGLNYFQARLFLNRRESDKANPEVFSIRGVIWQYCKQYLARISDPRRMCEAIFFCWGPGDSGGRWRHSGGLEVEAEEWPVWFDLWRPVICHLITDSLVRTESIILTVDECRKFGDDASLLKIHTVCIAANADVNYRMPKVHHDGVAVDSNGKTRGLAEAFIKL